jgi:hypothetical protein
MAFKAGHLAYIGLDNAAGSVQNISTYADNVSFPQQVAMLDVTTFGSSVKRFIPGLSGGDQVTISGPMDVTLYSQLTGMVAAQAAGTAGLSLLYGPGGSVSGQPKISAEVYVIGPQVSSGVGGRAEMSFTLQVDGAVTNATW